MHWIWVWVNTIGVDYRTDWDADCIVRWIKFKWFLKWIIIQWRWRRERGKWRSYRQVWSHHQEALATILFYSFKNTWEELNLWDWNHQISCGGHLSTQAWKGDTRYIYLMQLGGLAKRAYRSDGDHAHVKEPNHFSVLIHERVCETFPRHFATSRIVLFQAWCPWAGESKIPGQILVTRIWLPCSNHQSESGRIRQASKFHQTCTNMERWMNLSWGDGKLRRVRNRYS